MLNGINLSTYFIIYDLSTLILACLLYTSLDALHRFGVQNPVQATVFEDSPVGIATARAAGFAIVGIYDEPMAEFWPQITQTADFASRTWQDWLQNVQPVSYTHLDVYKRQPIPCAACCMPCCCPAPTRQRISWQTI